MIKTRDGRIIVTNEKQNKLLRGIYGTVGGRILLRLLTAPVLSEAVGAFMDSPLSKPFIKPFIRANKIDTSQYVMSGISSYNDFFTRKVKSGARPIDICPEHLISPCDGKLSAYRICGRSVFRIKDSYYRVSDLLKSAALAEVYKGGWCLIFRLEVDDYHRYCYVDSGTKSANTYISGVLHTVNPIALEHYNFYKRNCREYTILHTDGFGDIIQVEVGAMLVGKIKNHHEEHAFRRGEEKGMFLFGGSTVVLLIQKDRAEIDDDILRNTANGFETVVKYGEKIGNKK
ncbi:MAG: phosphatidylserine decarboxylase [Ruminococcus sp.]|nr:phosphatidylserine decarboxylase [Ruminococcus sp.]